MATSAPMTTGRSKGLQGLLVLLAIALALGLGRLFFNRFAVGDIYPDYSSLRADQRGTKIWAKAVARLPGWTVRRNHLPLIRLQGAPDKTVLFLGLPPLVSDEDADKELGPFLDAGGRAVITLAPVDDAATRPPLPTAEKKETAPPAESPLAQDPPAAAEDHAVAYQPVLALGELVASLKPIAKDTVETASLIPQTSITDGLPTSCPWHGTYAFDRLPPSWMPVYTRGGLPVVAARMRGDGLLVVCADSAFVDNEAMLRNRTPELLAWLAGPGPRELIFDETEHGLTDEPGLAWLARRYRLQGAVAVLLLVAALFFWHQNAPLLAAPEAGKSVTTAPGISSRASIMGLENLLLRHIPKEKWLATCFHEWRQDAQRQPRNAKLPFAEWAEQVATESAKPAAERRTLELYRKICHAIARPPHPDTVPEKTGAAAEEKSTALTPDLRA